MFTIRNARSEDVDAAVAALGQAFALDPLMLFLFGDNPAGVPAGTTAFFSMLLRARIALEMPAFVLQRGGDILGAVMGYDTSRPAWPAPLAEEWRQFGGEVPSFADRLAAYETICDAFEPREDHYYLGVLGVHPSLQREGAGRAMLDLFCATSRDDPRSHGVYLETASRSSLEIYYRNGFELRGEGRLDASPLWCVYKQT